MPLRPFMWNRFERSVFADWCRYPCLRIYGREAPSLDKRIAKIQTLSPTTPKNVKSLFVSCHVHTQQLSRVGVLQCHPCSVSKTLRGCIWYTHFRSICFTFLSDLVKDVVPEELEHVPVPVLWPAKVAVQLRPVHLSKLDICLLFQSAVCLLFIRTTVDSFVRQRNSRADSTSFASSLSRASLRPYAASSYRDKGDNWFNTFSTCKDCFK